MSDSEGEGELEYEQASVTVGGRGGSSITLKVISLANEGESKWCVANR
jgi:hypothetical protein